MGMRMNYFRCIDAYESIIQSTSVITDPRGSPKMYVITEVRYIRGLVKLRLKKF
jgi:hypothetical protein